MFKITQDEIIEFLEEKSADYDGVLPCSIEVLRDDSQEWVDYCITKLVDLNKDLNSPNNLNLRITVTKDILNHLNDIFKIDKIIKQEGSKPYDDFINYFSGI